MKKFKWSEKILSAISVLLLTVFVSCGSDDDDNNRRNAGPQEQTEEGTFVAVLAPENTSISSAVGTAEVKIQADDFTGKVNLVNARNATHAQHIHSGTRCPTSADDTNNDGVVDAVEAAAVYGPVVVPLDNDLQTNAGTFPTGPTYSYKQTAPFSVMLANLNLPALDVEGLVVNIHGIPESVVLPATAQGGKAAFPIACGVLVRLNGVTTGGTPY